jgi:hypothetical protein
MFEIVGYTVEGSPVVSGIFRFVETHGLPLEIVLDIFRERAFMPCWMSFHREATKAGMSHERIIAKLDPALVDVYGPKFRDHVIKKLKLCYVKGLL